MMRRSTDKILTSHAGSLPRPDALIAAWAANDEKTLADELRNAVADIVRHQREIGIDVPGDGEFGKPMCQRVNYGSWWRYSWQRLSGIDPGQQSLYEMEARRSRQGEIVLTSFGDRRDRALFAALTTTRNPALRPGRGRRARCAPVRYAIPGTT
jgi:5-methyltetrahydropteroyltriglutamate--homocysteine methyltransferase